MIIIRKGLFILYYILSLVLLVCFYNSFLKEYKGTKTINYEAIVIPFFVIILTIVTYILLFILNKIERRNSIYQFKRVTIVFLIMSVLTVVGYILFII